MMSINLKRPKQAQILTAAFSLLRACIVIGKREAEGKRQQNSINIGHMHPEDYLHPEDYFHHPHSQLCILTGPVAQWPQSRRA